MAVDVQVLHQLDLALGVAHAHGDDTGTDLFGAVMRAQAAGEQAVAVADLDDVAAPQAAGRERPGQRGGPAVDVAPGVADDRRLARRARRYVVPHDLVQRRGEHLRGIVVAQVLLEGERQFGHVVQALDLLGLHAGLVEPLPVEG